MKIQKAQLFYENFTGTLSQNFIALPQSGSSRINYVGENYLQKHIITFNENLRENESFFYFSTVFESLNLNSPKILKISDDRTLYIQEYLGKNTLSEIIDKEGLSERVRNLIKKTLFNLAHVQIKTQNKIDYSQTFEYEKYNDLPITNDLFYFKSFIAEVLEMPYHKATLLLEFKKLTKKIESVQPIGLMLRDFQARNIMVSDEDDVFFIDYQSAMKGPLIYDVISFLFQAKANLPLEFKNEMLTYYFSLWEDEEIKSQLKSSVKPIQLIRYLQVLGAYGFRGLIQKKHHFISSLGKGIENLVNFANDWEAMTDYPELKNLILQLKSESVEIKIKNIMLMH